jgi:hypothetical protein
VLKAVDMTRLEESLDDIRNAPSDAGTVELIVARPAVDERVILSQARLDLTTGLEGDTWKARGSSRTEDGSASSRAVSYGPQR